MAISTKPGGKYDTENGQYVSDGSSDAGQSKKQEPTKMQKIGEALKEYNNKRFYIPLNFFGKRDFSNVPIDRNPPKEVYGFASKKLLNTSHHSQHMKDMGYKNSKEYEQGAIDFWKNGKGDMYYSRARKRFYKYNKQSRILIVVNKEGIIHTFFKLGKGDFENTRKWDDLVGI